MTVAETDLPLLEQMVATANVLLANRASWLTPARAQEEAWPHREMPRRQVRRRLEDLCVLGLADDAIQYEGTTRVPCFQWRLSNPAAYDDLWEQARQAGLLLEPPDA